jgi:Fe-S cluster assembly ATP-binding protein
MKQDYLKIENLYAGILDKEILKGINLTISKGDVQVIMGPNGSGKSTLAEVLMGSEEYTVSSGDILFNNKKLNNLKSFQRAKEGLFLAFQYPVEVPGVNFGTFLHSAYKSITNKDISIFEFILELKKESKKLGIDETFLSRNLNEGLSGGEKKRMEILQIAILKPKFAILDEIDSGLDIDGVKFVTESIKILNKEGITFLIITHQKKLIENINISKLNIMSKGKIVKSGTKELLLQIEKVGYKDFLKNV